MIRVRFDPSALTGADLDWWNAWKARADKARAKVRDAVLAGEEPAFNDAIWKDLKKQLLVWAFHGKCAYCESLVQDATDNPAAEHFRPKRAPTQRDAAGVEAVVQCNGKPHPGYYWLAYEWRNLVPACSQCNSNGKGNTFPVRKQHVSAHDDTRDDPAALDLLEEPLLLHPYFDDPAAHLSFGDKGVVAALDDSDRGKASIEAYRLAREGLRVMRAKEQERAWSDIDAKLARANFLAVDISKYQKGEETYCAAVLAYVVPKLRAKIDELTRAAAHLQGNL